MSRLKIRWNEASTRRGAVMLVLSVVGTIGWWLGKDVTGLITLAMAVSGGIGVAMPDQTQ